MKKTVFLNTIAFIVNRINLDDFENVNKQDEKKC